MKLADLFANARALAIYPEIALVLFLVVFALVVFAVCSPRISKRWEEAGALPLEETNSEARSRESPSA